MPFFFPHLYCTKVVTKQRVCALLILWCILFFILHAFPNKDKVCHYKPQQPFHKEDNTTTYQKQQRVKSAFQHAWVSYKKYAFGYDELLPLTQTHADWLEMGLSIVDSIDTMYLMGLMDEYNEARDWIVTKLDFSKLTNDVSTFETTIRVVGGLVSIYQLTNDEVFLEKAEEIGDKIMFAFNSPSGIPYPHISMKTGKRKKVPLFGGYTTSLAAAGSMQMEFTTLSNLTNTPEYGEKAMRVFAILDELPKPSGLYPLNIDPESGKFTKTSNSLERAFNAIWGGYEYTYSLGSRGDSFFEYLLKMWILTGKKCESCRRMYEDAMRAAGSQLLRVSDPSKFTYIVSLYGDKVDEEMQHLACFLGGLYALGAYHNATADREEHMELGRELTRTCRAFQERQATGLSPETVLFQSGIDFCTYNSHYVLRPEIVESFYVLHWITEDVMYQEWGWDAFLAIENFTSTPNGFCGVMDVTEVHPKLDNLQQSFFMAETLKYLYLLFTPKKETVISLDTWVFNTEAHPMKIRN